LTEAESQQTEGDVRGRTVVPLPENDDLWPKPKGACKGSATNKAFGRLQLKLAAEKSGHTGAFQAGPPGNFGRHAW
jgi:hypothetical protein